MTTVNCVCTCGCRAATQKVPHTNLCGSCVRNLCFSRPVKFGYYGHLMRYRGRVMEYDRDTKTWEVRDYDWDTGTWTVILTTPNKAEATKLVHDAPPREYPDE